MNKILFTVSVAAAGLACAPCASAAAHPSQHLALHKIAQHGAVAVATGTSRGGPLGSGTVRFATEARPHRVIAFAFRERLAHGSVTATGQLTYTADP